MKSLIMALLAPKSDVSMMRLMSLICCMAAIGIAFMTLYKGNPDFSGAALLCSTFLGAAFGGKVIQKQIEKKD